MNKNLFATRPGSIAPEADAVNVAGGKAYKYDDRTAAAVFAMTATFPEGEHAHHLDGDSQLSVFLNACAKCDPEFIAKLAVYARYKGKMKDAPLLALLSLFPREDGREIADGVFSSVVDTPPQYRNATQIVRSGVLGFKSFGSRLSRVFNARLFSFGIPYLVRRGLVGKNPSLADCIRLTHPKPLDDEWRAFFGYVCGHEAGEKTYNRHDLPQGIKEFEDWKANPADSDLPKDIEILQLMGMLPEGCPGAWQKLARRMSWTQLFKNVATLSRHGALDDADTLEYVVGQLGDREKILKSRQFPYAIFNAYRFLAGYQACEWRRSEPGEAKAPLRVLDALQDALDIAVVENAPKLDGTVVVGIDTSGSMFTPVTGHRPGATSTAHLVDVAALFGASVFKQNPTSLILPFDNEARHLPLNARDSVATITGQITQSGGGGTNISDVFAKTLEQARMDKKFRPDAIILLTDMQTWIEGSGVAYSGYGYGFGGRGTDANEIFQEIKSVVGKPVKLVCWNLSAGETTQAVGSTVLNVGGWSESLWQTVVDFLCGAKGEGKAKVSQESNVDTWLSEIEAVPLTVEGILDWRTNMK